MKIHITSQNIDSLTVAVVLMASVLSSVAALAFGISAGANVVVLLMIFFLIIVKMLCKHKKPFRLNQQNLILIMLIVGIFIITKLLVGSRCDYSFTQLLFYSIIPICVVDSGFDRKKTIEYSLVLSLFSCLIIDDMFSIRYIGNNQAALGRMYSMLTIIILALIHFKFYRKESTKLIWITYIYSAYVLLRTIMVANRGVFLSIIVTIFLCVLYDFDSKGQMKRIKTKQIALWLSAIVTIVFIGMNFALVINTVISFLSIFGSVPSFFLKMQRLIGGNDILNGRNNVYSTVMGAIKESPLFGNGMSTFAAYTNGQVPYPHNFILQFMYEGGIIFSIIPVFLAVRILISVLMGKEKSKDEFVWQTMLVCQCYPKSLLSGDAWKYTILWIMIGYSFYILKPRNYNSISN